MSKKIAFHQTDLL